MNKRITPQALRRGTLTAFLLASVYLAALPALADPAAPPYIVTLASLDLTKATQGYGQPAADKTVDGHPLTLHGQTFASGFGTHTPALLAIDLHKNALRFLATVGIDDEVGAGNGTAQFQLWGDSKPLWKSGVLHSGDTPEAVAVPLAGISRLILRVTTAGASYNFGHADWADARLEMTPGTGAQTAVFQTDADTPQISLAPPPDAPQIHPPAILGFRPGTPLLWTVPVTGLRPLAFSAKGLPKGLSLDAATGTIRGTTPKTADYAIRVQVKNRAGVDSRVIHLVSGPTAALTPPMGWNSYDGYGDSVTEAEVLANAAYVQKFLQPCGWDTVVVDYRWYDPGAHDNNANARAGAALTLDSYGRLLPSPNRFPSAADGGGFRTLAAQVHKMGLRFGIHIMRGIPRNAVAQNLPIDGTAFHAADAADTSSTCPWCQDMYGVRGDTDAGRAYYKSLLRLYASWGVDFIKMDDTSRPYHTSEIEAVSAAIAGSGRTIVYSLSPGETPLADAGHVETHANQWRVSDDFWDTWTALDHEFTYGTAWHDSVGHGHWPDADMLPVGHLSVGNRSVRGDRRTQFSKTEQVTLLSLWALLPSPLMVGAALPDNDPWTRALLTNPDVLAVNQDPLGAAGRRVSTQNDGEVWVKALAGGSKAVGLFNRGDFAQPVTAHWADLGLSRGVTGRQRVQNLWQKDKPLGTMTDQVTFTVPPHSVVFLKMSRP